MLVGLNKKKNFRYILNDHQTQIYSSINGNIPRYQSFINFLFSRRKWILDWIRIKKISNWSTLSNCRHDLGY